MIIASEDLYQELILDHNKNPHNLRSIKDHSHSATGHNPLCGDKVSVQLKVEGNNIIDICFNGYGCAISTASASLMSEALKGRSIKEAQTLFQRIHKMLIGKALSTEERDTLGKLIALSGVYKFPARVKCATLAWHALITALEGKKNSTTTEK